MIVPTKKSAAAQQRKFDRLRAVWAQAVEHARLAQRLAAERRGLIEGLIGEGFSQSDIARELGVTRQAIHRMLAAAR